MQFTTTTLLLALALAAPTSNPRTPPSCTGQIVTACEGDNTWTLVHKAAPGTSLTLVAKANPQIPNLGLIFPGDQICIPEPQHHSPRRPATCSGTIVTIHKGDTTNAIVDALVSGTSLDSIQQCNSHIEDFSELYPGDQLCIPAPPPKCDGILYTINQDDSIFNLMNIGQFKGTHLPKLQTANPGIDLANVTPGEQVCFPTA
jgi:hypothetical protein